MSENAATATGPAGAAQVAFTLLHLSDVHASPTVFQPDVAEALLVQAEQLQPTLTVVSGDLVQREWLGHFRMAREFVQRLPSPRLIIPGNHDLPIVHLWETLTDPRRRFREYITTEEPFFHVPGLVVAGIDSTIPLLSGGYLRPAELQRLAARLREFPPETCRVVVVHHPLVTPPRPFKWRRLTGFVSDLVFGTRRALDVFENCGVEVVLSGHLHHAFIGNSLDFRSRARRGTILVQAGTATSERGRWSEHMKNTFNLIRITATRIVITHFMYFAEMGRFAPLSQHVFPRRLRIPYFLGD